MTEESNNIIQVEIEKNEEPIDLEVFYARLKENW